MTARAQHGDWLIREAERCGASPLCRSISAGAGAAGAVDGSEDGADASWRSARCSLRHTDDCWDTVTAAVGSSSGSEAQPQVATVATPNSHRDNEKRWEVDIHGTGRTQIREAVIQVWGFGMLILIRKLKKKNQFLNLNISVNCCSTRLKMADHTRVDMFYMLPKFHVDPLHIGPCSLTQSF